MICPSRFCSFCFGSDKLISCSCGREAYCGDQCRSAHWSAEHSKQCGIRTGSSAYAKATEQHASVAESIHRSSVGDNLLHIAGPPSWFTTGSIEELLTEMRTQMKQVLKKGISSIDWETCLQKQITLGPLNSLLETGESLLKMEKASTLEVARNINDPLLSAGAPGSSALWVSLNESWTSACISFVKEILNLIPETMTKIVGNLKSIVKRLIDEFAYFSNLLLEGIKKISYTLWGWIQKLRGLVEKYLLSPAYKVLSGALQFVASSVSNFACIPYIQNIRYTTEADHKLVESSAMRSIMSTIQCGLQIKFIDTSEKLTEQAATVINSWMSLSTSIAEKVKPESVEGLLPKIVLTNKHMAVKPSAKSLLQSVSSLALTVASYLGKLVANLSSLVSILFSIFLAGPVTSVIAKVVENIRRHTREMRISENSVQADLQNMREWLQTNAPEQKELMTRIVLFFQEYTQVEDYFKKQILSRETHEDLIPNLQQKNDAVNALTDVASAFVNRESTPWLSESVSGRMNASTKNQAKAVLDQLASNLGQKTDALASARMATLVASLDEIRTNVVRVFLAQEINRINADPKERDALLYISGVPEDVESEFMIGQYFLKAYSIFRAPDSIVYEVDYYVTQYRKIIPMAERNTFVKHIGRIPRSEKDARIAASVDARFKTIEQIRKERQKQREQELEEGEIDEERERWRDLSPRRREELRRQIQREMEEGELEEGELSEDEDDLTDTESSLQRQEKMRRDLQALGELEKEEDLDSAEEKSNGSEEDIEPARDVSPKRRDQTQAKPVQPSSTKASESKPRGRQQTRTPKPAEMSVPKRSDIFNLLGQESDSEEEQQKETEKKLRDLSPTGRKKNIPASEKDTETTKKQQNPRRPKRDERTILPPFSRVVPGASFPPSPAAMQPDRPVPVAPFIPRRDVEPERPFYRAPGGGSTQPKFPMDFIEDEPEVPGVIEYEEPKWHEQVHFAGVLESAPKAPQQEQPRPQSSPAFPPQGSFTQPALFDPVMQARDFYRAEALNKSLNRKKKKLVKAKSRRRNSGLLLILLALVALFLGGAAFSFRAEGLKDKADVEVYKAANEKQNVLLNDTMVVNAGLAEQVDQALGGLQLATAKLEEQDNALNTLFPQLLRGEVHTEKLRYLTPSLTIDPVPAENAHNLAAQVIQDTATNNPTQTPEQNLKQAAKVIIDICQRDPTTYDCSELTDSAGGFNIVATELVEALVISVENTPNPSDSYKHDPLVRMTTSRLIEQAPKMRENGGKLTAAEFVLLSNSPEVQLGRSFQKVLSTKGEGSSLTEVKNEEEGEQGGSVVPATTSVNSENQGFLHINAGSKQESSVVLHQPGFVSYSDLESSPVSVKLGNIDEWYRQNSQLIHDAFPAKDRPAKFLQLSRLRTEAISTVLSPPPPDTTYSDAIGVFRDETLQKNLEQNSQIGQKQSAIDKELADNLAKNAEASYWGLAASDISEFLQASYLKLQSALLSPADLIFKTVLVAMCAFLVNTYIKALTQKLFPNSWLGAVIRIILTVGITATLAYAIPFGLVSLSVALWQGFALDETTKRELVRGYAIIIIAVASSITKIAFNSVVSLLDTVSSGFNIVLKLFSLFGPELEEKEEEEQVKLQDPYDSIARRVVEAHEAKRRAKAALIEVQKRLAEELLAEEERKKAEALLEERKQRLAQAKAELEEAKRAKAEAKAKRKEEENRKRDERAAERSAKRQEEEDRQKAERLRLQQAENVEEEKRRKAKEEADAAAFKAAEAKAAEEARVQAERDQKEQEEQRKREAQQNLDAERIRQDQERLEEEKRRNQRALEQAQEEEKRRAVELERARIAEQRLKDQENMQRFAGNPERPKMTQEQISFARQVLDQRLRDRTISQKLYEKKIADLI